MARTANQLAAMIASAIDSGYKGSVSPGQGVQVLSVTNNVISVQVMDESTFVTKTVTVT